MHSIAIGLLSLLLGASATPFTARQIVTPVTIWNLTTFSGDNCDDKLIHSFQGSGSESCGVLTGSASNFPGPGGPELTQAKSVLARTIFGTYDFSFFPDGDCVATGILERIYEVDGESCLSLGNLDPQSFNVTLVTGNLKSRNTARQGPLDTWAASSFTSSDCSGKAVTNIGGTNATSCNVVPTSESCCPVLSHGITCECIREVTIESLLVTGDQGTHDVTVYAGDQCKPTGVNNPRYSVGTGEQICITLPVAGSAGTSFLVDTE